MSNEAEIEWQSRPAGEIADESQRLINLFTTSDILNSPTLVSALQLLHTEASKMSRESVVQDGAFYLFVKLLFERVVKHVSDKKHEVKAKLVYEMHEGAATVVRWAFDEKDEKKAREAHKKERKKAHQKALKNKGVRANDKKCKEDAKKERGWSWFDLQDTEHQVPFIERELEALKGWKDGHVKPPTPVLDRLYFCLKESGTLFDLKLYVEACIWNARYTELNTTHHTRGGPPKLRDFVNGSVLEIQRICDVCQARVAELDKLLERAQITQAMYDSSRAIIDRWRVSIENMSPEEVQEVVDEAKAIRSTKEKLEQAYESELRVPSSIVGGRERYKGLLEGNPVDRALSRSIEVHLYH
ncbi:hypothetical protein NEUTE1DRAFT_139197 [Neurospora tetrasperma FGSC 2508]|uniref:Uncharacterized protein n=1 Tax=Neurospora tetrasperma (strain FGSC 2508 / ATCC MYA-4615 / P0657) TaxID=510951 RepID=F8MPK1_NEUT8|nr:uncharacterized protein NEUTE1DRAFT_139197 [Neurospora tetrasperma FGSC 2508]EGO57160.1 hypothetical protein NEUTE1DRAFT_139197 [Neurospora tetrasperma FGSC 2508]EGZ69919.1 hypothetical protein NEUTE2DRAFT_69123 [Neurospora tetrasperma FGSC 2509]